MRGTLWFLAAILAGLALLEISMQPTWPERIELALIFSLMAAAMWAAAHWLPRIARRNRSIKATVAILSVAAFSIVVAGAVAVGNRMFLSSHDLTLLLVVIAFGIVAAVGFTLSVTRQLTLDLDRLSQSAARVAVGHLEEDVTLDRRDEIGRLSLALDQMVDQLEETEELRQADSQSRQDFFAAVGHDLRTPLASMQAAVEAIKDGVAPDPAAYLLTIEKDIRSLTSLVDDIYLLARLDSGASTFSVGVVDVTEIADESVEILRPVAAAKGVALRLDAADRVLGEGSAEPIGRVLRNLVDNAVRHSPAAGEVVVRVATADGHAHIAVIDEGLGFEQGFVPFAFDRFSRSESSRARDKGGSGLGLAIAKSLVESMNGQIGIRTGNHGHVWLDLPAPRQEQPVPAVPRRRTSSLRRA